MPYTGHRADSHYKVASDTPNEVAPAERADFDPANFANQPGAAARAGGHPRDDGQSGSINSGGRIANGSARRG